MDLGGTRASLIFDVRKADGMKRLAVLVLTSVTLTGCIEAHVATFQAASTKPIPQTLQGKKVEAEDCRIMLAIPPLLITLRNDSDTPMRAGGWYYGVLDAAIQRALDQAHGDVLVNPTLIYSELFLWPVLYRKGCFSVKGQAVTDYWPVKK